MLENEFVYQWNRSLYIFERSYLYFCILIVDEFGNAVRHLNKR